MLTDRQKNVAVRVAIGQSSREIVKEMHVDLNNMAAWLKDSEFMSFVEELANKNRELVLQYMQSKQFRCVERLGELLEQNDDLKTARQSAVDLLGFSGLENKNVAGSPTFNNINTVNASEKSEEEIDNEIEEIDSLMGKDD